MNVDIRSRDLDIDGLEMKIGEYMSQNKIFVNRLIWLIMNISTHMALYDKLNKEPFKGCQVATNENLKFGEIKIMSR